MFIILSELTGKTEAYPLSIGHIMDDPAGQSAYRMKIASAVRFPRSGKQTGKGS